MIVREIHLKLTKDIYNNYHDEPTDDNEFGEDRTDSIQV